MIYPMTIRNATLFITKTLTKTQHESIKFVHRYGIEAAVGYITDIPCSSGEYTIYSPEVSDIHRGEAEVNIMAPRVNKSYIHQEKSMEYLFYSMPCV